jgi:hypothetical protein
MAENLGPPVAWQIRDVPEAIREAVTEQARVEGVKVAELLTRLVLDARAAGWSMAASTAFANPPNSQDPARLHAAVEMVGRLGQAGVPVQKGVATLANQLIKRELTELKGARRGAPLALPAPKGEANALLRNESVEKAGG